MGSFIHHCLGLPVRLPTPVGLHQWKVHQSIRSLLLHWGHQHPHRCRNRGPSHRDDVDGPGIATEAMARELLVRRETSVSFQLCFSPGYVVV